MTGGSMSFGPYRNRHQAASCLTRFAAGAIGPGTGVIWCEAGGAELLQPPGYRDGGFGLTLVARSRGPVKPPPAEAPPAGTWAHVEHFVESVLTRMGEAEMARAQAYQEASREEVALAKAGWSRINAFIEGHETAVTAAAVGFDAIGILAGVASAGVIIAGGVAVLPVLGVTAGIASVAMLMADGRMLSFEVSGDQAGVDSLKHNACYRWTEAVGPILLLPDLIGNAPAAIREVRALPEEIRGLRTSEAAARDAAAAARDDVGAFSDSRPMRESRDWAGRKMQRLRTRANKLARDLKVAQEHLEEAQAKLRTLRLVEVPAYAGSVYAHTMYMFDPPDLVKRAFAPEQHAAAPRAGSETHRPSPLQCLLPPDSGAGSLPYQLDLHVGVSRRPEPAAH